eukprot:6188889-Pleurochrysis_carterae.AAC.1
MSAVMHALLLNRATGADSSGGPETDFKRARAHRIRSAHQLIRLWQQASRSVHMFYADSPLFAV